MKDRDRKRFQSSITWFNQFFTGMKQIYELVANLLPVEFFPEGFSTNIENFYYPAFKASPSIPPYYAFVVGGRKAALQLVAVIDEGIIPLHGAFSREPSLIAVLHTRPEKCAWLDEFALKVIGAENLEQTSKTGDILHGKIAGKYPADFFAFQVQYDLFSDIRNPPEAVSQYIVKPITTGLEKGWLAVDEPIAYPTPSSAIEEK